MIQEFQSIIYEYYTTHKRPFPWRETHDPYQIMVSEFMLQQTQTDRVTPKYLRFIEKYPTVQDLAKADFKDILQMWSGLGYNRRALALKKSAEYIVDQFNGNIPTNERQLQMLPGVGPYTAAAICAFAFNKPTLLIETNIRTVFIYFFFQNATQVHDNDIVPLILKTMDATNPREWMYALMDYGVMLKKRFVNPGRKSKLYTHQTPFHGSPRELRGKILRLLIDYDRLSEKDIASNLCVDENDIRSVVDKLVKEKLINKNQRVIQLS